MLPKCETAPQKPWLIIGVIGLCALAGWTGAAEGAWCSPTLSCLAYIPFAAFGGILFAIPAAIIAASLVLITALALRINLSPVVILVLMAVMALAGFLFGSAPGVHGQGP